jgi:hypothetical protein
MNAGKSTKGTSSKLAPPCNQENQTTYRLTRKRCQQAVEEFKQIYLSTQVGASPGC